MIYWIIFLGVLGHIRRDSQLDVLCGHLHNPLPQQDGSTGGEGLEEQGENRGLLWGVRGRQLELERRKKIPRAQVSLIDKQSCQKTRIPRKTLSLKI